MSKDSTVNRTELPDDLRTTIRRFIVCEEETATAAALWIMLTWLIDHVQVAPLAIINAPELTCGKSQLLNLLEHMAARPVSDANSTAAGLFRAIALWKPTVLIDEADIFIRENKKLKGLVNAGHTCSNTFVCVLLTIIMNPSYRKYQSSADAKVPLFQSITTLEQFLLP